VSKLAIIQTFEYWGTHSLLTTDNSLAFYFYKSASEL